MTDIQTEVEELLGEHSDVVADTARLVRGALLDGFPDLIERVRRGWHSVNYHHPDAGFLCAVFPLADRVQLVFERGAQLADPRGLLTGSGKTVRALEFRTPEDVDPEIVVEYADQAVAVGAARRRGRARP